MKIENETIIEKLGKIDLFICSSGFEERSTKLALNLDNDKLSNTIIFHLDDTYKISNSNLHKIQHKIHNAEVVFYPKNNALNTFDTFYLTLKKFVVDSSISNVVIDISAFTREVLLILIKVISLEIFSKINFKIIYTPNESYSANYDDFWMTKGIREIRSIIGYSGLHSPSKKLLLLILNGFEEERTEHIIQCFEPERIIIGKPDRLGSINENLNTISCSKFDIIKNKYATLIKDEFEFSCTDISVTIDIIDKVINQNMDYNIVIAPLNNKISTIGAAIVGLKNEEVQLCYASANQYNIDTKSEECNYYLMYDLNPFLGNNFSKTN